MNLSPRVRTVGLMMALAVFFAAFLFATVAENKPPEAGALSGVIPGTVVAPAEQFGRAFAAVAAHVKPAVVSVYSQKMVKVQSPDFTVPFSEGFFSQFFGQQMPNPGTPTPRMFKVPERGMGSGMILDERGGVLTNYHVVKDVDEIKVQLADRRDFKARIVGSDPKTDVAVIRIVGDVPGDLPTVQLGDSDAMQDGNLVIAVGAPFGLAQTVTSGIISAVGRSNVGIAAYEDFLQTDAPINPGNSGGPLVNMRGEVIGMTSAIATNGNARQFAGVGFAIPSNMIKSMLPTLVKGGTIARGELGVVIQDVTQDLAVQFGLPKASGALIAQVNKDSPAAKAGLKAGDTIVSYAGKEVRDPDELRNLVAATAPGTRVDVGIVRDGKAGTVAVTVGKMSTETKMATAKPSGKAADRLAALGLRAQTLTPELAERYNLQGEQGAVILSVAPESPASLANLEEGDLIFQADHMPVTGVADLQRVSTGPTIRFCYWSSDRAKACSCPSASSEP